MIILKYIGIIIGSTLLLFILISLIIFRRGFGKIDQIEYSYSSSRYSNWENVFDNPASIEVIKINNGIYYSNSNRADVKNGVVLLLRHEQHGDILIDSGLDSSYYSKPPLGNYPFASRLLLKIFNLNMTIEQEKGEDIVNILHKYNASLKRVFLTHTHVDHTAGVPELPDDIEYVVNKQDITFLSKALSFNEHMYGKKVSTFTFDNSQVMPILGECIDLLGDGSLWAVSTPGHSPGHTSYLINSVEGTYFVTGDAIFTYDFFDNGEEENDIDIDPDRTLKSRNIIYEFYKKYPQIQFFVGHDQ